MIETVLTVKAKSKSRRSIGQLVARFLAEMHRFDAGRTLPLLHGSRLTTPQLAVLEFARQPRTVSAVADHLGLSLPATSQMAQKLVQRGLIRRSEGAVDRREKELILSADGEALLDSIAAARAARFEASLAVLPSAVAAGLETALSATIDALHHLSAAASPGRPRRNKP